jgi:hypothetical protein
MSDKNKKKSASYRLYQIVLAAMAIIMIISLIAAAIRIY